MSLRGGSRITPRLVVEPGPSLGGIGTALVGVRVGDELEHLDRAEVDELIEVLEEARR